MRSVLSRESLPERQGRAKNKMEEEKQYDCDMCEDTGEVACTEDDGEGHSYRSTKPCPHIAEAREEAAADDYEPDTI